MTLKQEVQPCMPPLLLEETIPLCRKDGSTKFGGTACENIVKSYFLSKGINIAEPYVDNGVDILIEKPEGWVRGQVKKVVYQYKCDSGMKKRGSGEVYRSRYNFNFQGGGTSCLHLKNGRRQRKAEEIDYFYHVLLTPYRQLIWETPVSLIPLREDGTFVHGKTPILDRKFWIRKKSDINYNELLIHSKYDPIIFKIYPEFFII
jgi:hypothetical protein